MMATLLKHEWLRTRAMIGTIAALDALVVIVCAGLAITGWSVVSTAGMFFGVAAALALVPVLQIAMAVDYWLSSYRRTGYFTHSLPIRGSKIFTAKIAWALLVTLAAIVVTLALTAILWTAYAVPLGLEANPFTLVGELVASVTGVMSPWLIVGTVLLFLVMYLIWPVQYFFVASIGSETPLNRLGAGGPVIVFAVLYVVSQLLSFVGMFAIPLGIGPVGDGVGLVTFNLIGEIAAGSNTTSIMPIGFVIPLVLLAVVCWWRTAWSWNRKVTLV